MRIDGVLFDVGYTLMDETARLDAALVWLARRADGVSVEVLRRAYADACLAPQRGASLLEQALVAAGRDSGSGPDLSRAKALRRELSWDAVPLVAYPDARAGLARLRAAGVRVGVLANQPASAADDLERARLAALCDGVWLSEAVGLAKPDPRFFGLALEAWRLQPASVAYVGDRPDNDVGPANELGLASVRVRLGPHRAQRERGTGQRALLDVATLAEAVDRILSSRSVA